MSTRERITAAELTQAYRQLGFFPDERDPFTFRRASDDAMFFHEPSNGEFYWAVVVEDIERSEMLNAIDEGLAERFMAALAAILTDES